MRERLVENILAHSKGKNSTDISLVISAMEILYTYPYITGFCIISSDSDFTELVVKLKENNKFVMGIGKRQTPPAFVKACHKFKYTDDYKSTDINPEQISIILEKISRNKVNR